MRQLLILSVLLCIVFFTYSVTAQNWQMQNSNFPSDVSIVDFSAVNNQVCWAVAQKIPDNTTPYAGYIRTTDGGDNWICDTIHGISSGYFQQIFAIDSDTAYATVYVQSGGSSKGIYKTTDGGTTWNKQNAYNTSLYGPGYIHFFDAQNGVVIGDPNLETYTTTNGGLTWNLVNMPNALQGEVQWLSGDAIKASGNTVWFGTSKGRLLKSTDRGYTWTVILSEPLYERWFPCIAFQDTLIGIYSLKKQGDASDHIYRKTTNGGKTWNTISNSILDNIAPTALQHISGTNATYIVSGDRNPGMTGTAITNDAGTTWNLIDNIGNSQIIFPSAYVGWGSQLGTNVVKKYVGPPLSVEEEQIDEVPTGYLLSQNYPNPFNPTTSIQYSVPKSSKVLIKVFDVLGNEIETLVNEEKSVGTYELNWNAANLPSGVYFYQLRAGSFVETKKMILLK